MPGELEAAHGQDLHEVAHVHARRRGVEAAVQGQRSGRRGGAERLEIGRVGDEPPPGEVVEDGHAGPGSGVEGARVERARGLLRHGAHPRAPPLPAAPGILAAGTARDHDA